MSKKYDDIALPHCRINFVHVVPLYAGTVPAAVAAKTALAKNLGHVLAGGNGDIGDIEGKPEVSDAYELGRSIV